MKFGVVIFPGSNCDQDLIHVLRNVMHQEVKELWHKDDDLQGLSSGDCILLPGGFSFGDYLRPGGIASFSPVMNSVKSFANNGGYVWGICNGFQILCETGLLPGVLMRNSNQQFICKNVYLTASTENSAITNECANKKALKIPIAHADGRYFADEETMEQLKANNQILFRYCDEHGNVSDAVNPNGSLDNIAGICNKERNVFGMMPHPERCSEDALGNTDGKLLFDSLLNFVNSSVA